MADSQHSKATQGSREVKAFFGCHCLFVTGSRFLKVNSWVFICTQSFTLWAMFAFSERVKGGMDHGETWMQVMGVKTDSSVTKPFSLQLLFPALSSGMNCWLSCVLALFSPNLLASLPPLPIRQLKIPAVACKVGHVWYPLPAIPMPVIFRTSENSPVCLYLFFFLLRTSQVLNFVLSTDCYINFLLHFSLLRQLAA